MNAELFVKEICNLSFENTFNPYSDRCDVHDYFDAPKRRRALLTQILTAASKVEVDSIWIGRDLGYRGGRRTGLALTDDVHLVHHAKRWGITVDRLTKGRAVPERTAAVIWSVLSLISSPVFLWNVFPLHPFEAGDPFSNRVHNAKERIAGEELLVALIQILRPRRIIAIGNDAEMTAMKIKRDIQVIKVRHPSYGGQTEFLNQINSIYRLSGQAKQVQLL
jgi:uracil-DNA glycosylase